MEKNYNDIEFIESWLQGKMQQADRQAFETQLATDDALQREVNAYRKIFNGFQAARHENFAAEVGKWSREAKAAGEKKPVRSIQSSPSQMKKGKVVQMKRSGATVRPLWQKLAMAAGFALLIGAAAFWWMSKKYTDEKLVASAYVSLRSEDSMGEKTPDVSTLMQKFDEAHRLFKEEKYEESSAIMSMFIQEFDANRASVGNINYQFFSENARWTKLLADFAAGKMTEENMLKILDFMERQASPDYARKAKELREGLRSPWRK